MNSILKASVVSLFMVGALGVGKCNDEKKSAKAFDVCESMVYKFLGCEGASFAGCDEDDEAGCNPECHERWEVAHTEDEGCGDRYIEVYECILALSCDDLYAWSDAIRGRSTDHDCEEIELKFRAECPDLNLYGLD